MLCCIVHLNFDKVENEDISALINLDQSRNFDRVDHHFLEFVLSTVELSFLNAIAEVKVVRIIHISSSGLLNFAYILYSSCTALRYLVLPSCLCKPSACNVERGRKRNKMRR